jgi:hypothetical protein
VPTLNTSSGLKLLVLAMALAVVGCDRNQPTTEGAVEGAKDALDMREHEKLKDAGEDAVDAVENAAEGVKDEVEGR